jgi:N-acetylneuraminic acid mutarotase
VHTKRRSYLSDSLGVLLSLLVCISARAQTSTPNQWVWMGGSTTLPCSYECGQPGVYGALTLPSAQSIPGGRLGAASWTDASGNFWLFGGTGFASTGVEGYLNDLWKFSPSANTWTWMGGTSTGFPQPYLGPPGVYGTLGTAASGNVPGGRQYAATWTDRNGHFWLFGGDGYDGSGNSGMLNDLWEFDPSTGLWTWVTGSNTGGNNLSITAVYGTLGASAPGNTPGGRFSAASWIDGNGNLWLFGGTGLDANGNTGFLNDLWEFNPSTSQWVWIGGSSTVPVNSGGSGGQTGVYGTRGVAVAGNIPGGRQGASAWTDSSGNLWLFGGDGIDSQGNPGLLNDLFEFAPSTGQWTWACGSNQVGDAGLALEPCGDLGSSATGYVPGSRMFSTSWTGSNGELWLFGGGSRGIQAAELNDIWVFDTSAKEWTWKGGAGTNSTVMGGVYGTLATPSATNIPGGRDSSARWIDAGANLWLFGGIGNDQANSATNLANYGYLNDLWAFSPSGSFTQTATPSFSVAAGTYTSAQSVTLSDASPSATIYYTTDGSTPTVSSAVYSSFITVSATETIQAIATSEGLSASSVASATYTINVPPNFAVAASPASMTVIAGQSATSSISVTPANGFNSAVSFSCSGLPSGVSCSFSPATVTPSDVAVSTTLTIATTTSAALHRNAIPFSSGAALAAALCCIGWRKRRRWPILITIAAAAIGLSALSGCGSGSSSSSTTTAHQPTTSAITVTAASGSLQHSTDVALTVD